MRFQFIFIFIIIGLLLVSSVSAIAPSTAFSATPTLGNVPLTVIFNDTSANGPTMWNWSFGDGTWQNGTTKNATHTYTISGSYTAMLITTNVDGSSNFSIVISALSALPIANFTTSPNNGNPPLDVTFTNTSIGSITNWSWSFGDGSGSYLQNPVHTYSALGTYPVHLTIQTPVGDNISRTQYIYVVSNSLPIVDFAGTPTSGVSPLTTTFTDLTSGTVTGWNWSFGDGNYSNAQNPSHIYGSSGQYTVTLIATNGAGSSYKTYYGFINVGGYPMNSANVNFTYIKITNFTIQFTDTSICNPVCNKWYWDFDNDGSWESHERNPIYTFTDPKGYKIKLTAGNDFTGSSKIQSIIIDIPFVAPTMSAQPTQAPNQEMYRLDQSNPDLNNGTFTKYWLQNFTATGNFSIYGFAVGLMAPIMHVFGFWIYLIIWGLYLFAVWIRSQDVTLPLIIGIISIGTFGLLFPKESVPVIIIMFVICGAIIITKLMKDSI